MSNGERTQISMRVPTEMIDSFERIATALDRDRTWVMVQAFRSYLEREGNELLIDADGIASVDRGETLEWASAMTRIDAAITRGATSTVKKAG